MLEELKTLRKEWDKNTEGWKGTVIYLVLGFIIAYGFNVTLGYALQTDTPVVAVFSDSMDPTFYKGDMIIVSGRDPDVKVGDIIIFDVPDRSYPIIHRIYQITDQGIRTKGDNNPVSDPWVVPRSSLHGKALVKIPILGWVKIIFVQITGVR